MTTITLTKRFIAELNADELEALIEAIHANRAKRKKVTDKLDYTDMPPIVSIGTDYFGNYIFAMGGVEIWNNRPYLTDALIQYIQDRYWEKLIMSLLKLAGWSIELSMYHLPTIERALKNLRKSK